MSVAEEGATPSPSPTAARDRNSPALQYEPQQLVCFAKVQIQAGVIAALSSGYCHEKQRSSIVQRDVAQK